MSSYNLLLTYRKKGIQYYDNLIKLRFMQLVLIRVCKKRKKFVNREKVFFFKRQKLSFCRSLRKFICKLKVFLERDGSLLFLKNQQLIKLKQCLCLQLTKYTKLKVVIAWLRELITFLH